MRILYRIFWLPFYRLWALRHIRQTQVYRHGSIQVLVPPGVFHPGLFFSTPIFLDFLKSIDFQGKNVLDMGAGSGMLGLFVNRLGAIVTATDINPVAVGATRRNAEANGVVLETFTTIQSDLFDALPPKLFDVILINPPYYPRRPQHDVEYAFFAGENLEYFEKLFRQMPAYINQHTNIWMILSEDCDYQAIQAAAKPYGFELFKVFERKKWGERLFVVHVRPRAI